MKPEEATPLLRNSLRLFKDAKLLFDNERYPSAAVLAILSFEELGKFLAEIGFAVSPSLEKRLHQKKQEHISGFLLRTSYVIAVAEYFKLKIDVRGSRIKILEGNEQLFRAYLDMDEATMDLDKYSEILAQPIMGQALRIFTRIHHGDLNRMKNSGLYADMIDGVVREPEKEIKTEDASGIIRMCEHLLGLFRRHIDRPVDQ
jgi:AbiV family abortive infection protein